jgi:hypothetical protein
MTAAHGRFAWHELGTTERRTSIAFYPPLEAAAGPGGTVIEGPMEVARGDAIVQCPDPRRATFALHTPKASSE